MNEIGYRHPDYAPSLAAFGTPRRLVWSNSSILVRNINGGSDRDGIGCYPLFCCEETRLYALLTARHQLTGLKAERFKGGWSQETRQVYLCGRVFNAARYAQLSAAAPSTSTYFPACRRGELTCGRQD